MDRNHALALALASLAAITATTVTLLVLPYIVALLQFIVALCIALGAGYVAFVAVANRIDPAARETVAAATSSAISAARGLFARFAK